MRDQTPLFLGVSSPQGFTEGPMMMPETCILWAVLDYISALLKGTVPTSMRWELIFQLSSGQKIKLPIRDWVNCYSVRRPVDQELLPLPRYSAHSLLSIIEEFLEDIPAGSWEQMYFKGMQAWIMSLKTKQTFTEKALVGGLYLELCAMREKAPDSLQNDALLERIITCIRQPPARASLAISCI